MSADYKTKMLHSENVIINIPSRNQSVITTQMTNSHAPQDFTVSRILSTSTNTLSTYTIITFISICYI